MKMNRKASSPAMVILVIVALLFSTTALLSFVSFSGKFGEISSDYGSLGRNIDFYEDYVTTVSYQMVEKSLIGSLESDGGPSFDSILKDLENNRIIRAKGFGNIFAKMRTGDYEVTYKIESDEYLVIFKDIFVVAETSDSRIKRDFDLIFEFDESGKIVKKEKVYKQN